MKPIKNSILEMAQQIQAGMKVTEDGLIEAGDMPTPPEDSETMRVAAMARMLQVRGLTGLYTARHIGFSPQFIATVRQEVGRYLRGTYVLKHKGNSKRRHKLRNDGAYIQILPMATEAQKSLDAAYDRVLEQKGLLRRAVFGDMHIGSMSPTRDRLLGGHTVQVEVINLIGEEESQDMLDRLTQGLKP